LIVRAALLIVPLLAGSIGCTAIAGYDDRAPRPDEVSVDRDSATGPTDTEGPARDTTGEDAARPDTRVADTRIAGEDTATAIDTTAAADTSDVVVSCAPSTTSCDGRCVDLAADPLHCGACGVRCGDQQYCDGSGKCACRPGLSLCGGACVDIATDPSNCGGCGVACDSSDVCGAGSCKKSCAGLLKCAVGKSGSCINPAGSDPTNCGACGKRCSTSEVCVAGTCRAYSPGLSCTTCPCDTCGILLGGARCCAPMLGQRSPVCVAGTSCP
jgi:hypothetical protein